MKSSIEYIPTVTPEELIDIVIKEPKGVFSQVSSQNIFHINRIEDFRQLLNFPMPPHRKTVSDFIFITHGSMRRRLGLTTYEVVAGGFIFLPAHQISLDEWMSEDIQGYYCHFAPELLTRYWQKQDLDREFSFLRFYTNPIVTLDGELLTNVLPLLNRLEREYKKTRANSTDLIRLYLLTLFTELKRASQSVDLLTQTDQNYSSALRFAQLYKNALIEHIYNKQTVAEYAHLLSISPNHLNKCIKTITGHSARVLMDEMILLEAKVMLSQTDLSVSEIAYKIGKQEPGNFARFFRLKTGKTPTAYRQMD